MSQQDSVTVEAWQELAQRGFRVFPVEARGKRPLCKWTEVATDDVDSARRLFGDGENVGIALGKCAAGNIVVIDVDGEEGAAYLAEVFGALPKTLTCATGRDAEGTPYRHYYYQWPDDDMPSSHKMTDGDGNAVHVDIKGAGGYVVGAGSVHANGNMYRWVVDAPITAAPAWLVQWWRRKKHVEAARKAEASIVRPVIGAASVDDVEREAIRFLTEIAEPAIEGSNGDATTFSAIENVVIGYGIEPSRACELVLAHYNPRCIPPWDDVDIRRKCDSAAKYTKKAHGFNLHRVRGERVLDVADDAQVSALIASVAGGESSESAIARIAPVSREAMISRKFKAYRAELERQRELPALFAKCGGGLADLVKYIRHDVIPQPHLECAAIVAIGQNWAGRRVVTRDGMLANGGMLGISESGTGKSFAFSCVERLALGKSSFVPPTFASRQAFEVALTLATESANTGVTFADPEIGDALKKLFAKNSSQVKQEISGALLRLVPSKIGAVYTWQTSVAGGGGAVRELHSPAVSLYGTSTLEEMQSFLTGASQNNGLLARVLLIAGIPDVDPYSKGDVNARMPGHIKALHVAAREAQERWAAKQPAIADGVNLGAPGQRYEPQVCGYTEAAINDLETSKVRWLEDALISEDVSERASFRRLAEHTERVAVALAVASNPRMPVVDTRIVEAAAELVRRCAAVLAPVRAEAESQMAEQSSPAAKASRAVFAAIAKAGPEGATASQVVRATQALERRARDAALDDLVEAGRVLRVKTETGSPGRPKTVYTICASE